MDNDAQSHLWLRDYEFIEELMINFGPYDVVVDAEVELVMNHSVYFNYIH